MHFYGESKQQAAAKVVVVLLSSTVERKLVWQTVTSQLKLALRQRHNKKNKEKIVLENTVVLRMTMYYSDTGTVSVCTYMDQYFMFHFKETLHDINVNKLLPNQHIPLHSVRHITAEHGVKMLTNTVIIL